MQFTASDSCKKKEITAFCQQYAIFPQFSFPFLLVALVIFISAADAASAQPARKESLPARLFELEKSLDGGDAVRISDAAQRLSALRARISGLRLRLSAMMSARQPDMADGERERTEENRKKIVQNYIEMERLLVLIGVRRDSPAELRALAGDLRRLLAAEDEPPPAPLAEHGRGAAPKPQGKERSNGQ